MVIDTNVWLDLYVFGDAAAQALALALQACRLQAIRNPACDAELRRVLLRPQLAGRLAAAPDTAAVAAMLTAAPAPSAALPPCQPAAALLDAWERLATACPITQAAPWRCTDADDQKFLDLAVSCGAALLVSKDRALLRLAGQARRRSLAILAPQRYAGAGAGNPGYR